MSRTVHYGSFDPANPSERLFLDREEALSYLGYAGQALDEDFQERFLELARTCERNTQAKFAWAPFEVDEASSIWRGELAGVCLKGTSVELLGQDIAAHLRGAREVVLMACTLGARNEQDIRRHRAVSLTDGTMYDACSSALVEACANAAEKPIAEYAHARGLHLKWRYSPGYGDLPLSVQPDFLHALDAQRRLGITTTNTYLMVPTKSITAVVGLFDHPQERSRITHSCDNCQVRDVCLLRAAGRTCRD